MARRSGWIAAAGAALGIAALALWIARPAEGPAPIAWDRAACAHCKMLVSDPHFAAQLQLEGGEVLAFDDPGCLLLARAEQGRAVRAVWFHDSTSERWAAESEVAFVRGAETPMGHGLAAVPKGAQPDALDPAAALAVLEGRR